MTALPHLPRRREQPANYRAKIEYARTSTKEGAGLTIAIDLERLQKAQKELEDFQNKVDPLRQKFVALEEHIKAAVDPALFEEIREAIRNANNEKLEDLKAQIGNVKWAAIEAREAIQKIQTAGQGEMWQRQVARLRREQGEFRGWLASEAKKYMDATGTTDFGSAWERMTSAQRKGFIEQREFVREDIAAEKAWEEQKRRSKDAASAAARANDDAAKSMLRSAQARQQEYQLELAAGDSLSQSKRELLKFELLLRDTKDKSLKAGADEIRAVLQANVALEDQIDATRRLHEAKLRALAVDRQIADYQQSMAQRHARDLDAIRFGGNTARWNEIANSVSDHFQQQRLGIDRELQDRLATIPIEQMARRNEEEARYQQLLGKTVIAEAEAMGTARKRFEEVLEAQSNMINGLRAGLQDYIAAAQDMAGQTREIVGNIFGGAEDLAVEFFTKGKADWKAYIDEINAQFLRLAIRQQLAKVAEKFLPGLGGDQDSTMRSANALSSAAGQLAASAAPLYGAAAAITASAAALSAAATMAMMANAAGGGTGGSGNWATMIAQGMGSFGYDKGGYTGPGGRLQPAGVVHKGEVVWSQPDVARAGGVAVVEAMRRGLRGYDTGGWVGGSSRVKLPEPQEARYPGRRMMLPSGSGDFKQNVTFNVTGTVDRRSASQIARESGRKIQEAMRRNG